MKQKILILFLLLLTACAPAATASPQPATTVLASTTFLADIAQNVAGTRQTVESLLPRGVDPHSYQPTPKDVAKISDSTVLIVNGAQYEQFIDPVLQNAGGQRIVIDASTGVKVRTDAGNAHGVDPHMWMDPNNVITYVENIQNGLSQADPDGTKVYAANAQAYIAQLQELDTWIKQQVNTLPAERRLLVTNHENLGYFAERYGFTVVGAVVPSFSSDASPSAQQMAALVDQVKATGAPAIFLDAVDNPTLAEQIANETGVKVVTDLHVESLTDGPPAATYIDMMKYDVTQIVDALK